MNLRDSLQDIYDRRGELTAAVLVEEAKPAASPLHSHFEWNNKVAGESYRLVQASQMIRSVKLSYGTDSRGRGKKIRNWLNVTHEEDPTRRSYQPAEEVVLNEFQLRLVLREAEREWKRFKAKYGHLREFAEIVRLGEQDTA